MTLCCTGCNALYVFLIVDDNIASEVQRKMQPMPVTLKKRKGRATKSTHGKEAKRVMFQKKLVVFQYMGENSPQSFAQKESFILFRALLPEMISEEKIREIIISVIHSNKQFDMTSFSDSDFEFIDVKGKHACVPTCQETQQFNARAVKQMVGTGAVYERLGKIPSRAIYVQDNDESSTSKSDRTSQIYISGSDSNSSVDLPSFYLCNELFNPVLVLLLHVTVHLHYKLINPVLVLLPHVTVHLYYKLINLVLVLLLHVTVHLYYKLINPVLVLLLHLTVRLYKLFIPVLVLHFHTHPPLSVHLWYKLLHPHITVQRLIYQAVLVIY